MFDHEKDAEAEQLLKEFHRVIAFLEANRTALQARGLEVETQLHRVKSDLAEFERICRDTEEAEQNFLQATANLADKEYQVFKETSELVDQLAANYPNDSEVQKIVRQREELKKQFPRED